MSAAPYVSDIGPYEAAEAHNVLVQGPIGERSLTCRWPRDGQLQGVIVFCHGLGASGRDYAGLSRHWAAHGYLVVHPTFSDSIQIVASREPQRGLDPAADLSHWATMPAVRARMHEILHSPDRWTSRVGVVEAVMAALPEICSATGGTPRAPVPAAIAGHSFGAYTTQLLAGAEIDMPGAPAQRFRDERFNAAIVLSGQGRDQQGLRDGSWNHMDGPVLTVTGTRDMGAKGGDWHWKCEPYDLAPAGEKYLAVLDEADHFLGGITERDAQVKIPAQLDAVEALTLAFLDAKLRGSKAARDWLASVDGRIGECPLLFKRK